jgi:hypothetical protein
MRSSTRCCDTVNPNNTPLSSRGLGRSPFKAEITGSNPVGGTRYSGYQASPDLRSHEIGALMSIWVLGPKRRTIKRNP